MKYRVYIDHTKANKEGQMPVVIIIEDAGKRAKVATGLHTSVKFSGREFPSSEPNHRAKNMVLGKALVKLDEYFILKNDEPWKKVVDFVKSLFGKETTNSEFLYVLMRKYANTKKASNTQSVCTQTAKKIQAYDKNIKLPKVSRAWMDGFSTWMEKQGLSINTRALHLMNVKALMSWAYDEEYINTLLVVRYKIKREAVVINNINNISVEELRCLRDCHVTARKEKYRDLFMLSFYLCGINPVDLLHLTQENVHGSRIIYRRRKTGKIYNIPFAPEAKEIVERYKGKKYLLRFMDDGNIKFSSFLALWNTNIKNLRDITFVPGSNGRMKMKAGEPLFPNLTLYSARYTFASLGAELEIPRETIALCLGHSWVDVTSHYIAYDLKRIDEAVRKIIDYVNADLK